MQFARRTRPWDPFFCSRNFYMRIAKETFCRVLYAYSKYLPKSANFYMTIQSLSSLCFGTPISSNVAGPPPTVFPSG